MRSDKPALQVTLADLEAATIAVSEPQVETRKKPLATGIRTPCRIFADSSSDRIRVRYRAMYDVGAEGFQGSNATVDTFKMSDFLP